MMNKEKRKTSPGQFAKRIAIGLLLADCLVPASTAQVLNYTHDANGNRVERSTATVSTATTSLVARADSGPQARVVDPSAGTIKSLTYVSPGVPDVDKDLAVGHIPYTFEVKPNGAVSFTIPIPLPAGQAGMTPEISIQYNSQAGESVLGHGMNLSCLSAISRSAKRKFYDGKNEPLQQLQPSSAFELDGSRLVLNLTTGLYQKEQDDYSRITAHHGEDGELFQYFELVQKDGTRLYYGDYGGRVGTQTTTADTDDGKMAWYLSEQHDPHGNIIRYNYRRDVSNGDIWLTSIEYTLHPDLHPLGVFQVEFSYRRFDEAQTGYFLGKEVKRDKVLTDIRVFAGHVLDHYSLDYIRPPHKFSSHWPRLHRVQRHVGDGADKQSLNPLVLQWGTESEYHYADFTAQTQNGEYVKGDFNGDGQDDLLQIIDQSPETPAGQPRSYTASWRMGGGYGPYSVTYITTFTNQYQPVKAYAGDFDGNGLDDIVFNVGGSYEFWSASLDKQDLAKFTKQTYKPSTSGITPYYDLVTLADVDGDGRDELVIQNACFDYGQASPKRFNLQTHSSPYRWTVADVNGDGCQDIITYTEYGYTRVTDVAHNKKLLEYSFSSLFGPNSVLLTGYFNDDPYLDFASVNGYDGPGDSGEGLTMYYGTGKTGEYEKKYFLGFRNDPYFQYATGDFNGDGMTDIISVHSGGIDIAKANGSASASPGGSVTVRFAPHFDSSNQLEQRLFLSPVTGGTPGQNGYYRSITDQQVHVYPSEHYFLTGDFSGDGKCDVLNITEFRDEFFDPGHPNYMTGSTKMETLCFSYNPGNGEVVQIDNGDGTRRTIGYASSQDISRSSQAHASVCQGWHKALPVVSLVDSVRLGLRNATSAPAERTRYRFTDPLYVERGVPMFMGFASVEQEDLLTRHVTTDTYAIASLRGGYTFYLPKSRVRRLDGEAFAREDFTFNQVTTYTTTTPYRMYGFPYLNVHARTDLLKGVKETLTYTYDADGNLTKERTRREAVDGNTLEALTKEITRTYVRCADVSSFPSRVATYQVTHTQGQQTIVEPMARFTYNSQGDLLRCHFHDMQQSFAYGANGLVLADTLSADGQQRVNTYEYDFHNLYVNAHTDPVGLVTRYERDTRGNLVKETSPAGLQTTYTYDGFGRQTSVTSPDGVVTATSYLWNTNSSDYGCTQQTRYDGNLVSETRTDSYGRTTVEGEQLPGGKWKETQYLYNLKGQIMNSFYRMENGALSLTFHYYDNYLRPTREMRLSGCGSSVSSRDTIYYTYNGLSETRRVQTDKTYVETTTYGLHGQPVRHVSPVDTTLYAYDAAGRLSTVQSAGYPVTYAYNDYGLCTSISNPSAGTTTIAYNGFDEEVQRKDAKGNVTTYTYDLAGRIASMDDGEGTTTYTYNPKGQLQSQSRAGHRIQYAYDAKGHLQQETKTIHNQSLVKHYTYDAKGRLSTYTSPSGLVQQYGYNTWHDLVSVTDATRGTKLWEATEFNGQGLVSAETNFTGQQTTYDYDGDGRITSIAHPLATSSYAYTLGGLTAQRTEAFGTRQLTETFGHDNAGRLWSVQRADAPAVLVTFSRGSRIGIKTDVGSYAYGATPGSPLQQVEPVEGYRPQRQQLTYYKNRMPKTVAQGSYTRTYEYGPDGQRDYSTLVVSGSQPFAPMTTYYFDDYEQNINHQTGELSEIDYIFAEGRLVALVRMEHNQRVCYGVLTDRQGSVKALYDAKGLVQRFSYDAWGNRRHPETGALLTATELAEANRITRRGYTGHEHMDEFGLINMNARLYDPRLGMFVSPDPLGEKYYDVHPYTYCGGNPLDAVDPTGMAYWITGDGAEIRRFWQWWEESGYGGTQLYALNSSDWEKFTDEEFVSAYENGAYNNRSLVFDDDTNTLFATRGSVEDGEVVIRCFMAKIVVTNMLSDDNIISAGLQTAGDATFWGEHHQVNHKEQWRGKNGKRYPMRWGGNQYTGPRSKALKAAKAFRWAGRLVGFMSIGYTAYEVYHDRHNPWAWLKGGIGAGLTLAGMFVSAPIGIGITIAGCIYSWATYDYEPAKLYMNQDRKQ